MADTIVKSELIIYTNPDYCGSDGDKEFVFALSIGNVTKADSLFGYNFQLSYDTSKIELNDALFINTLSENCYYKQAGAGQGKGQFLVTAMDIGMVPITGDKPLAAISGKILGSCIDSTIITLDYLAFTKEFTRDSIELTTLQLNIEKIKNSSRFLTANFDRDTIKSNEDSIVKVSIEKNNTYYLNNPTCYLIAKSDIININSIKSLNENVSIEDIQRSGDSIEIIFSGFKIQDKDLFQFEVNNSIEEERQIYISIIPSVCDCFTELNTDVINYKYIKNNDSVKIVNETKHYILNYTNNILKVNDVNNIKRIKIYNIYGAIKAEIDNQYSNDIEINFEKFENGVYEVLLESDNSYGNYKEKRILVIKN
jgi:hypothetical protein